MHRFQINSNGDTAETLIDEFKKVKSAADALTEALKAVTINGRNYQTLPNATEALAKDAERYREMRFMVQEVSDWAVDGAIRAMDQK